MQHGERPVWTLDGLVPNSLDALVVTLHSSTLEPGDYRVRALGLPRDGEPVPVARFAFRLLGWASG